MWRAALLLLTFVVCLSSTGCSASKEDGKKYLDKIVAELNSLADILAEIKDDASAKAAIPKIQAVGGNLKELKENSVRVLESIKEEIADEYAPKLKEAQKRVVQEMFRVAQLKEGREAVDEAGKVLQMFESKE